MLASASGGEELGLARGSIEGRKHMRIARFGLAAATAGDRVRACRLAARADGMRGSVKDAPDDGSSPGRCYLRADVGYSWSRDPDVSWTVTDPNPGPTQWQFVTDRVTDVRVDNSWLGEAGAGCGSGPRGIRGEVMLGYHGKRNFDGDARARGIPMTTPPQNDPLHSAVDHQDPDVQRLLRLRPLGRPVRALRRRRRRSLRTTRPRTCTSPAIPLSSIASRAPTAGRSPGR